MDPRTTLTAFDEWLAARSYASSLTIVGGTALALLGVTRRATRDCDVLEPLLDPGLLAFAQTFALERTAAGMPLDRDWLNNGPASLAKVLPEGWRSRVVTIFAGQALSLRTLGRHDLLASKLWALCDRGTDLADCVALAPTVQECNDLRPWLHDQDANPDWPAHVDATLAHLGARIGHGLSS